MRKCIVELQIQTFAFAKTTVGYTYRIRRSTIFRIFRVEGSTPCGRWPNFGYSSSLGGRPPSNLTAWRRKFSSKIDRRLYSVASFSSSFFFSTGFRCGKRWKFGCVHPISVTHSCAAYEEYVLKRITGERKRTNELYVHAAMEQEDRWMEWGRGKKRWYWEKINIKKKRTVLSFSSLNWCTI